MGKTGRKPLAAADLGRETASNPGSGGA